MSASSTSTTAMWSMILALSIAAFFIEKAPTCKAWGSDGHMITSSIAQELLQLDTNDVVRDILHDDGGLLWNVSLWADRVRHVWPWTKELHYVNTPDWACVYNEAIDCGDQRCLVEAINNYTERLLNPRSETDEYYALKFLTHYVGDLSMPLHVSFESDRGGNGIRGQFLGNRDISLHRIWDSSIIKKRIITDFNGRIDDYTKFLIEKIYFTWDHMTPQWIHCLHSSAESCSGMWASESAQIACENAYSDAGIPLEDGFVLDQQYYEKNLPIIEMQLARGGVRLAAILNYVWSSDDVVAANSRADAVFPFPESSSFASTSAVFSVAGDDGDEFSTSR